VTTIASRIPAVAAISGAWNADPASPYPISPTRISASVVITMPSRHARK
jgi:hypothetical protein